MKNLVFAILFLISFCASAQKIGGFYTGTLYNDTTHMVQQYELALGEYRGKISGYSYVTFVSNDTFYYGIRKIKAAIVGDSLVVQDDKMIVNNFPEAPARGVGRIITIPLNGQDSLVSLNGRWRTNQTKKYYSVPGSIRLSRSQDSTHSPLIAHLKELGLVASANTAQTDNTVGTSPKPAPPLPYSQRGENGLPPIEIRSDSLVLSFYDNGVVDGDSISVYVDNVPVVTHARLATVATRITIPIKKDETKLVLVAENLGAIPPNTGLLTIRDGDQQYQVNFSADMQTNASIIIKRKK